MTDSAAPISSTLTGGGKEEVRAATLKPYFLRIRAERGDRAATSMALEAGIDESIIHDETSWVSADRAKRALRKIAEELGPEALRTRGVFGSHPEVLGSYVRMLRTAKNARDAYGYLAANAAESTRLGEWELLSNAVSPVRMTFKPRDTGEAGGSANGDDLLCAARIGELASLPSFWGDPEAGVAHPSCLARGDDACVYDVTLARHRSLWALAPLWGASTGAAGGLIFGLIGGLPSAALAAALGGAFGATGSYAHARRQSDARARVFERNRIAALERNLELKGAASATPGDLAGHVLGGKYKIGKKLGSGGIGVVYAAEHVSLGHEVAIKVLRGAAAKDGSEIARLRREAQVQVHVDHPNIARVLDLDQMPDGSIYVVMERLIGRSLADKLGREGLITPAFAVPCFVGVCAALAAAHAKGVVHRDLKPGNVFLCEDGSSKVLDFGMSKLTSAESLTQAGYTLGTPEYMAPEQCIGAPVEARTDVYALGVLMYEALTGELPIASASRRELLELHQRKTPSAMRDRRPDLALPAALDHAIMRCLRKKIEDRPAGADELGQMLAAIPIEGLPLAYPPGTPRKRGANVRA